MTAMLLVLLIVAGAVVTGLARGGRIGRLAQVDFRYGWLVLAAVALQIAIVVAGPALPSPGGRILLAGSHLALLGFVWTNRLLPGMTLVFLGFLANAVVITANGAMPVSRAALRVASGGGFETFAAGKHRLLEDGDRFWLLADILPIPLLRTVVSVGDIALAAGAAVLVMSLMTQRSGRSAPSS